MTKELLEKLINASGVSGNETKVRNLIKKEIKPYVDEIHTDNMGNLITRKKGKGPKVMLAAHMDEIGLIVKSIDKNGKIHCAEIGGITPEELIGQIALIQTDKKIVRGVLTTKATSDGNALDELPLLDEIVIDTGLNKKELQKTGTVIGSTVMLERRLTELGSKDVFAGKALDDRIGCYMLLEVARKLKHTNRDIYFVFTVQEEIGLFGSKTSAYTVDPDWAIAVDVASANDSDAENATKSIGGGPCLTVKDAELMANKTLNKWIQKVARKRKIPLQLDVSEGGTTDALSISLSKNGVPATSLGVCIRNIHTTISIASRKDIKNAITILTDLLKSPPKKYVLNG